MQFFFCLDVVSAICMYVDARKWEARLSSNGCGKHCLFAW